MTVFIVRKGYKWEGSSIIGVYLSADSAIACAKRLVDTIGGIRRAHLGSDKIKAGFVAFWMDESGEKSGEYVEVQKYEVLG